MKQHIFLITGTSPLLMHNPAGMTGGPDGGMGTKHIPTAEEEAKAGRYVTEDGHFYLPAQAFKACMVSGGKGRRIGKSAATSVLKSTVFCVEDRCILLSPKTKKQLPADVYEVDVRRVVLKNGGKTVGILRARPKVAEWSCKVVFEVDDEIYPTLKEVAVIEQALGNGGRMVGAGDYRPEKGGPFGRFTAKLI